MAAECVFIVCEYNPFHLGHEYQIKRTRELIPDAVVVAVMSGNFVQRGDVAIADKYKRARCAVQGGADIVIELPFPYSMAASEKFAQAAVSVADGLCSGRDYLSFGCEDDDARMLSDIASALLAPEFEQELIKRITVDKTSSYAKIRTDILCELGFSRDVILKPNNILAIDYIKAIKKNGYKIALVPIKRLGMGINDTVKADSDFAGATYIREKLNKGEDISAFVPSYTSNMLSKAYNENGLAGLDKISSILLNHLRNISSFDTAEMTPELMNILRNKARQENNIQAVLEGCVSKKYTAARIRRAAIFSFFKITADDVAKKPSYALLLGASKEGCAYLSKIKRTTKCMQILTKASDYKKMTLPAQRCFEASLAADNVYALCFDEPLAYNDTLRKTPYVEK